MPSLRLLLFAALLLGLVPPSEAAAQLRTEPPEPPSPGRALTVGARVGVDIANDGLVLGGQIRIPVDPWRRVEVMPSASVDFLSGITEMQLEADAAVFVDRQRRLYVGGGAAFRNTVYEDTGPEGGEREFRTGYSLIAGARTRAGGPLDFGTQLQIRYVSVDRFEPLYLTLGLNFPLVVF